MFTTAADLKRHRSTALTCAAKAKRQAKAARVADLRPQYLGARIPKRSRFHGVSTRVELNYAPDPDSMDLDDAVLPNATGSNSGSDDDAEADTSTLHGDKRARVEDAVDEGEDASYIEASTLR